MMINFCKAWNNLLEAKQLVNYSTELNLCARIDEYFDNYIKGI